MKRLRELLHGKKEGQFRTIDGKVVFMGGPGSGGGSSNRPSGVPTKMELSVSVMKVVSKASRLHHNVHYLPELQSKEFNQAIAEVDKALERAWGVQPRSIASAVMGVSVPKLFARNGKDLKEEARVLLSELEKVMGYAELLKDNAVISSVSSAIDKTKQALAASR